MLSRVAFPKFLAPVRSLSPTRFGRPRRRPPRLRAGAPDRWILAADTIVMIDGQTLGKPRDERHAGEMLRLLSGQAHNVVTAFVVLCPGGRISARQAVATLVRFRLLSERVIEEYVAGGNPSARQVATPSRARVAASWSDMRDRTVTWWGCRSTR